MTMSSDPATTEVKRTPDAFPHDAASRPINTIETKMTTTTTTSNARDKKARKSTTQGRTLKNSDGKVLEHEKATK